MCTEDKFPISKPVFGRIEILSQAGALGAQWAQWAHGSSNTKCGTLPLQGEAEWWGGGQVLAQLGWSLGLWDTKSGEGSRS